MLQLFHWDRSVALQRYASGDIIVIAENVEEARQKAVEAAKVAGYFNYCDMAYLASSSDEDDRIEYEKKLQELRDDLAREPITCEVIFIPGSE